MPGGADDNPFQSPAVETSRREPVRYPKTLRLAQACGFALAGWILVECYAFPTPELNSMISLHMGAALTLLATTSMMLPHKIAAAVSRIYFEMFGMLNLMGLFIALGFAPSGHYTFFFLISVLLCMVVIVLIYQKPSVAYYARRPRR